MKKKRDSQSDTEKMVLVYFTHSTFVQYEMFVTKSIQVFNGLLGITYILCITAGS